MPSRFTSAAASGSSSRGLRSVARTDAPSRASNSADAIPDFFIPTTSALAPFRSISSQFQCRQREERQDQAGDPETGDDFRFSPADLLKVMVDRSHLEDSFSAQFETAHL